MRKSMNKARKGQTDINVKGKEIYIERDESDIKRTCVQKDKQRERERQRQGKYHHLQKRKKKKNNNKNPQYSDIHI